MYLRSANEHKRSYRNGGEIVSGIDERLDQIESQLRLLLQRVPQPPDADCRLYTTDEAGARFDVGPETVRAWVRLGLLVPHAVSKGRKRRYLFTVDELARFEREYLHKGALV